jgi:hypothetical protein
MVDGARQVGQIEELALRHNNRAMNDAGPELATTFERGRQLRSAGRWRAARRQARALAPSPAGPPRRAAAGPEHAAGERPKHAQVGRSAWLLNALYGDAVTLVTHFPIEETGRA